MSGLIEKIKNLFAKSADNPSSNATSQRTRQDGPGVLERERAPNVEIDSSGGGKRGFGEEEKPKD